MTLIAQTSHNDAILFLFILFTVGQVKAALLMSDEEFQNTYHAVKPQSYDHNIVFYGLGPIKSRAALELAKKAGFTKYVLLSQNF